MWCNNCNIETNDSICPLCGAQTIEDLAPSARVKQNI